MLDVTVLPRPFAERLKAIATVAPRYHRIRVLETIQLAVDDDGKGWLVAADPEVTARVAAPIHRADHPGAVQLPLAGTLKFLREARGPVRIRGLDPERLPGPDDEQRPTRRVTLAAGADEITLDTFPPEAFPAREVREAEYGVEVPAWKLARLIAATGYAAGDGGRYATNGCALEFDEGRLALVATDGMRLAHASAPADGAGLGPAGAGGDGAGIPLAPVVARKALDTLRELLDALGLDNARIRVAWAEDGRFQAASPELAFSAPRLEGRFPDWRSILAPPAADRAEVLDATAFARALAEVTRGQPRIVRLRLAGSRLAVEPVGDPEAGNPAPLIVRRPEADAGAGDAVACFDSAHLADWAGQAHRFTVEFPAGADRPAAFRATGNMLGDLTLDYYVMPRVEEEDAGEEDDHDVIEESEGFDYEVDPTAEDGPSPDESDPDDTEGFGVDAEDPERSDGLGRPAARAGVISLDPQARESDEHGDPDSVPVAGATPGTETRPIHTLRLGRIRVALRAEPNGAGLDYCAMFERFNEDREGDVRRSSGSFGVGDLLELAKAADRAHSWIRRRQRADGPS